MSEKLAGGLLRIGAKMPEPATAAVAKPPKRMADIADQVLKGAAGDAPKVHAEPAVTAAGSQPEKPEASAAAPAKPVSGEKPEVKAAGKEEKPAFALPEDPEARKAVLEAINQLPDVQRWISSGAASAIRTAETKRKADEEIQAERALQDKILQGDQQAIRERVARERQAASEDESLGRAALVIFEGSMRTLVEQFGFGEEDFEQAIRQSKDVPELLSNAIKKLDAKRESEFEKRLNKAVEVKLEDAKKRQRGLIPAPDRSSNGMVERPPATGKRDMNTIYEDLVARQ